MTTILDTIASHTHHRVASEEARYPRSQLIGDCEQHCAKRGITTTPGRFHTSLATPGLSFIAEVKKASPSRGIISPDFPYLTIAQAYADAGVEALSCLTEPKWFLGSDAIFTDIRHTVSTPMLRKDFIVDDYQIYQAALMGADAVLLICALLDTTTLRNYLELCDRLGLDALVETHTSEDVQSALEAGARIIGVNNRNLHDFSVTMSTAETLEALLPSGTIFVAESGITGSADVRAAAQCGADAVLVGEALMRAPDPGALLRDMRKAVA